MFHYQRPKIKDVPLALQLSKTQGTGEIPVNCSSGSCDGETFGWHCYGVDTYNIEVRYQSNCDTFPQCVPLVFTSDNIAFALGDCQSKAPMTCLEGGCSTVVNCSIQTCDDIDHVTLSCPDGFVVEGNCYNL